MPTYQELKAQAEELLRQAEGLREQEKNEAIADIKTKMQTYGITVRDLGISAAGAPKKIAVKARKANPNGAVYRSPEGQTWSPGRGRKPNWLVDALAAGKTLEDFRVTQH